MRRLLVPTCFLFLLFVDVCVRVCVCVCLFVCFERVYMCVVPCCVCGTCTHLCAQICVSKISHQEFNSFLNSSSRLKLNLLFSIGLDPCTPSTLCVCVCVCEPGMLCVFWIANLRVLSEPPPLSRVRGRGAYCPNMETALPAPQHKGWPH